MLSPCRSIITADFSYGLRRCHLSCAFQFDTSTYCAFNAVIAKIPPEDVTIYNLMLRYHVTPEATYQAPTVWPTEAPVEFGPWNNRARQIFSMQRALRLALVGTAIGAAVMQRVLRAMLRRCRERLCRERALSWCLEGLGCARRAGAFLRLRLS